jgi:hypothetical protein
MPTEKMMAQALKERSAQVKKAAEEKAKALKRAVSDVLDGSVATAAEAARARGLSAEAVSKAVRAERERLARAAKDSVHPYHTPTDMSLDWDV